MIAIFRISLLIFLPAVFFFSYDSNGQVILPENLDRNLSLTKGTSFLEDKNNNLSLQEIIRSKDFKQITDDVPTFGITESSYWLRINIHNNNSLENYLLTIEQPCLDKISLYYRDENNRLTVKESGEAFAFKHRDFFDPSYHFRIYLAQNKTSEIYIKVSTTDNFQIPIYIGTQNTVFKSSKIKDIIFGLYSGIMIVMLLYNLFIYLSVNDKSYLYYIIYIAAVILTQTSIQGYTFQYLWPDFPVIAKYSSFLFPPFVGISSAYFLRVFLKAEEFYPKLDKGFYIFTLIYIIAVLLAFLNKYALSLIIINMTAALLSIYMLCVAYLIYKKNYRPARFFLIAWSVFLIGVAVYVLANNAILPFNNFTHYLMPFGSAIEVVLLSFALADRINILKQEKEVSQAQVLMALQENQKLIKEQNIFLEQKVNERTLELAEANKELNVTLKDLKSTQAQLVSAEKMASLGQLTAGIAHEINNPINFVSANIKPLQMDVADILDVISQYESLTNCDHLEEKIKEIDAFKKKIDLEYTKSEIQTLLAGIEDGAKRTAEIVTGLKTFSRLDESDVKTANINDGIESTLTMIRSAIPENIKVVKHLGEIPIIECFPGKLNQVFMNTFNNAIHAIEETKAGGTLTISSYVLDDKHICVSVEDNGIGMTPETKAKIFEPFFTTKDVGQGTGLGMSIVFTIIESHKGQIDIETEYGKGTKIIFTLPMKLEVS